MTQEKIKKQIFITASLLLAVILIFQFSHLDIFIQSFFYNFETKLWIIDEHNYILDLIFYSGFKKIFIIFSIFVVVLTIFSFIKKIDLFEKYKKGLIILSLSLILVPSIAAFKNITNVPCPCNIVEFGGNSPDVKILESYPKDYIQKSKQKCWPAGHATMGFSLMALYFLFKTQRNKNIAFVMALAIGVLTGSYKVLIGDHFVSHTLVTMIAAWLIILLIARFVSFKEKTKT